MADQLESTFASSKSRATKNSRIHQANRLPFTKILQRFTHISRVLVICCADHEAIQQVVAWCTTISSIMSNNPSSREILDKHQILLAYAPHWYYISAASSHTWVPHLQYWESVESNVLGTTGQVTISHHAARDLHSCYTPRSATCRNVTCNILDVKSDWLCSKACQFTSVVLKVVTYHFWHKCCWWLYTMAGFAVICYGMWTLFSMHLLILDSVYSLMLCS